MQDRTCSIGKYRGESSVRHGPAFQQKRLWVEPIAFRPGASQGWGRTRSRPSRTSIKHQRAHCRPDRREVSSTASYRDAEKRGLRGQEAGRVQWTEPWSLVQLEPSSGAWSRLEPFFDKVLESAGLMSDEHFSVDGTLIEAWASFKSLKPKDGSGDDAPGDPSSFGARGSNRRDWCAAQLRSGALTVPPRGGHLTIVRIPVY